MSRKLLNPLGRFGHGLYGFTVEYRGLVTNPIDIIGIVFKGPSFVRFFNYFIIEVFTLLRVGPETPLSLSLDLQKEFMRKEIVVVKKFELEIREFRSLGGALGRVGAAVADHDSFDVYGACWIPQIVLKYLAGEVRDVDSGVALTRNIEFNSPEFWKFVKEVEQGTEIVLGRNVIISGFISEREANSCRGLDVEHVRLESKNIVPIWSKHIDSRQAYLCHQ